MKRSFILSIFFVLPSFIIAQERGVSPIASGSAAEGTTRAVVIGVSKYQDSSIPSLNYADVDAEEFAKFLQSKSGGGLTSDQLVLVTNEQATVANIYGQLDWLLENTKENDRVIFYFSGHGDVETKTSRNRGFLLAHDTPYTNYFVGALRVNDLNDILADLVAVNKAKVILVTDACRSGKLAGGSDGAAATASALADRFENQVKIMSCQPNELSMEGTQWGGGRGVFSYHLIEGLMGLADEDGNNEVDLSELDDYLDDRVPKETGKQQYPFLVGSPRTSITRINKDELAALVERKKNQEEIFASVDTRGIGAVIFEKSDTHIQRAYEDFLSALESQYFLPEDLNGNRKKGQSASELFDILSDEKSIEQMLPVLRRNFAVALQDESQKSINAYLKADPEEMKERWYNGGEKYRSNPAYLEKAASVLGTDHYLHDRLIAKKYYYEGLLLRLEGERSKNDSMFYLALEKEKLALQYDGDAAYIFNEIGLIKKELFKSGISKNIDQKDIGVMYDDQILMFEKAIGISPKWVMPHINLAAIYMVNEENDKMKTAIENAAEIDSTQIGVKWLKGNWYQAEGYYGEAINYYKQVIDVNPNFNAEVYNNLGLAYYQSGNNELAEKMYHTSIDMNVDFPAPYENLGLLYYMSGNHEACIDVNKKWIKVAPSDFSAYYNVACIYSLMGNADMAVEWLEKSIEKGFSNFNKLKDDGDLINARKSAAYKKINEKYSIEE